MTWTAFAILAMFLILPTNPIDQDTKNDFSPYIANAKISQEIARATAKKTTNLLESQIKLIWKSLPPCKATTKSEQPEPLCGSLSGSHKARARLAPL